MLILALSASLLLQTTPVDSDPLPIPRGNDTFTAGEALELAFVFQEWWEPDLPHIRFAPSRSRYNRIEGLSLAVIAGFEADRINNGKIVSLVRLGTADVVPNADVEYSRAAFMKRSSLTAYYRLSASNEWGNPLALGASLGALVIGRDEGFYYRNLGVQWKMVDSIGDVIGVRGFVERHRSARVKNDFSFADVFGDKDFHPNIVADDADLAGAEFTIEMRSGELATERRLFGELKLEAATGDFDYTRGMLEGIAATPLGSSFLVSLTASAGISGGTLPLQRNWFLGGSRSLRGQAAGVMVGDAFWMSQAELGTINVFARPALFFDAGWAGDRDDFGSPGRIGTGAGLGFSFFDGTLRFDLARGIYPGKSWRGSLYLEARM